MSEHAFEELLAAHFDDSLNQDERERLAQMLHDPQLARRFVVSCQMHAMLAWEHGAMPILESQITKPRKRLQRLRWAIGSVAAVAASILVAMSFITNDRAPAPLAWQERSPAGKLAASHGGRLSVPDLDLELHEGDALRVGDYQLAAGLVQIEMDGVELTVESPARFRVASQESVLLETGRLSARVPTNRKEFQVEALGSATAKLQPGAETSIEADAEASEIHVFAGDVEVFPKAQDSPLHLTSDTATRIARAGAPAGVDLAADRFTRTFAEPPGYAALVQSLQPVVYFRMKSPPDGVTLTNDAQRHQPGDDFGRVYPSELKRPPFAPGQIGSALRLQAQFSAYASYPRYPLATDRLTVCAWVRASSRPRWASIAKHWTKNTGQFQFGLHGDEGDLEIQVLNQEGEKIGVREHIPFPLGAFQFVAFVVDGSTLRLYRNGGEVGSTACEGLVSKGTSDLGIGVKLGPEGQPATHHPGFWDGRIDELAIFHRALTAEELTLLYQSGLVQTSKLALGNQMAGDAVEIADADQPKLLLKTLAARTETNSEK